MAATLAATSAPVAATVAPPELPLTLAWRAPEACPAVEAEREEIRRRVGQLDPARGPEPVAAEVDIRATPGGFTLALRTRVGDATGERTLAGPDCGQLASAAALVLALLINPDAPLAPVAPAPPPPPPPAPPPAPPPPLPEPGFAAGLDLVLAQGVLPEMAPGLALRFLAQRGPFAAAARVGGFLGQRRDAAVWPGASAAFARLEAALAVCAASPPSRRFGGSGCLGGALVRLHGRSTGIASPGEASALWVEGLAELSAHLRTSRHSRLRLTVSGQGLGSSPEFAILGLGSVYRPPPASLRGALAIDVLF